MTQKIKFIVAVFGVTVAMFGTINSKAAVRCDKGTDKCTSIRKADGTTYDLKGVRYPAAVSN